MRFDNSDNSQPVRRERLLSAIRNLRSWHPPYADGGRQGLVLGIGFGVRVCLSQSLRLPIQCAADTSLS